jgi:hypothetical protein
VPRFETGTYRTRCRRDNTTVIGSRKDYQIINNGFPNTRKYHRTINNGFPNSSQDYRSLLCQYSDWVRTERQSGRSSSPGMFKNFRFSTSSRPPLGPTQTAPIQWVPGAISLGIMLPGREADQSPTRFEVKKTWIYTSTPPFVFVA